MKFVAYKAILLNANSILLPDQYATVTLATMIVSKVYQIYHNLIKKWAADLNRYFPKDIKTVSKHKERCSTSLVIRKIKSKPP